MFKDQYRAVMQYSLPRDGRPGEPPRILHDWICSSCGVQNFRRRDQCFKCGGPKSDIDADGEGADEVSPHPTNTVLLRGLDALSTEDSVLNCLMQLTNLPIKSLRIGKDSLTNTSRGVCYVEMNSVVDAMFLHNQLLGEPPSIDDKLVSVSYFRPPGGSNNHHSGGPPPSSSNQNSGVPTAAANAALAAAQWSHQGRQGIANQYSHDDIERMAEYSASMYAKTAGEKEHYLEYYRNYYKNGGDPNGGQKNPGQTPQQPKPPKDPEVQAVGGKVMVNGVEYPRYPTPDVSTYSYDESSGYYYDASTQLYYDSNSQYYFDSKTNKYVYWSPDHHTYLPAPEDTSKDGNPPEDKNKKEEKKDKVKTAKRIAKDMEKWAKTLNQKAAKAQQQPVQQSFSTAAEIESDQNQFYNPTTQQVSNAGVKSTEDVAFSMLHNKSENEPIGSGPSGLARLTGYGSDSAEEGDQGNSAGSASASNLDEQQLTDWSKLACLLCKRQFPSREKLTKHNDKSDLHRNNLENWRQEQSGGNSSSSSTFSQALRYRDRAQERRQKYGNDNEGPRPNRLKEKYLAAIEEAEYAQNSSQEPKKIDSSNKGNKMLQKMGWKEGLGLGKTNQGRTTIIEADGRNSQAGLGSGKSTSGAKANPNESYKDSVKRTLFQRYHEMD